MRYELGSIETLFFLFVFLLAMHNCLNRWCEESSQSTGRRSEWFVWSTNNILEMRLDLYVGLSDPYCKVSVVNNSIKADKLHDPTSSSSSITPPPSPNHIKRNPSIFSCISSSCMSLCLSTLKSTIDLSCPASKNQLRLPSKTESRRSSKSSKSSGSRRRSLDGSSNVSSDKSRNGTAVSYRTEVRPKTINPEWNEHFEL